MGALAEVLLQATVSNFFICLQSNHLCTILTGSKTCGKKQLAQYVYLQIVFSLLHHGAQQWCFEPAQMRYKLSSFPVEPVQKILKGSAPTFRLCLQCLENQCRGFSRTCEDLLSGWTVSFCFENLRMHYVDCEC